MELFDILDKDGNPTGLTAPKGTRLQDGQYYLGVHVYVFNSALEFLLQQRAYHKAFLPGGWDIVCEHNIAGETSKDGAIRGVKEELGLQIPEDTMHFAGRMIWESYHHIVDIYFAKTDFIMDELTLPPSEVIGAKLISKNEMLDFVSNMRHRPEEYRQHVLCKIKKLI